MKNYIKHVQSKVSKTGILGLFILSSVAGSVLAQNNRSPVISEAYTKGGPFEGLNPDQELPALRTKYAKHFRNANGTYTLQSGDTYHYKDAQGAWQDIDLTISPQAGGFASTHNEIKSFFPVTSGNGGVTMSLNEQTSFNWWNSHKMSYSINGRSTSIQANNSQGIAVKNTITYPNVYDGISEEFVTLKNGIQNNTIINSLNSDLAGLNSSTMVAFTQTVPLKQGWKVDVAGAVKSADFSAEDFHISIPGTEQGIFFSPVVVFDHSLTRNEAIYLCYAPQEKLSASEKQQKLSNVYKAIYSVHFSNGNMEVTTSVPASWLQQNGRAFPVTIDPDVTITPPNCAGSYNVPTSNWYGFQRHADLYLTSELGIANVNITAIEYNRTSTTGTNSTAPIKVFMRTTSNSTLTADTWNSSTYTGGLNANYDGSMDLHGTTSGWKMIPFTNPFSYTTDNLIVMVFDAYGGSGSYKEVNRSTSISNRQAYKRQDGSDPGDGSSLAVESVLPEIRITYVPSAPPVCVTTALSPLDGNTICTGTTTLRWNKKERATGYDVYLNTGTAAPTTIVSTNQADTFYTFTATANDYSWKAIPKNGAGAPTGCAFFKFKAMTSITPDVTISRIPAGDTLCPGDTVVFTASPVNPGIAPVYQWKKNGVNVGTNSTVYTDRTLTAADTVYLILTSSITGSCVTKNVDTSNKMRISYKTAPSAVLSASGSTSFCLGQSVRLSVPAGEASYQWRNANGNLTNANTNSYTVQYSGIYSVKVTRNNGCSSYSDPAVINAYSAPNPPITRVGNIIKTEPVYASYQWYRNSFIIPGATTNSITISHDGGYVVIVKDTIGCIGTSAITPVNELAISNAPGVEEIHIFPNPANGIVNIGTTAPLNIVIRSVEGKIVLQKSAATSIDIAPLANGVYMIQLTDKTGKMLKIDKLIKSSN